MKGVKIMDCISVNADGWLEIGGVSTKYLAEKYGTPVYVMDEAQIRKNCREFHDAFEKYYVGRGRRCTLQGVVLHGRSAGS